MKLCSLSGKIINRDIKFYRYKRKTEEECRSRWQYRIGNIIHDLFPHHIMCEEFLIDARLRVDYLIPSLRLVIEADGKQHAEFNKFFHGTIEGFEKAKLNDMKKTIWCSMNNLVLVRIKHPIEDRDTILGLIRDAIGGMPDE